MRRPSVLFVNQHYAPDFASTGQHLTDLAEYLAADGFDVRVLCGQSRYLRGTLGAPRHERRNGVEVFRVPMTAFGRGRVLGRLADYATFYAQALRHVLRRRPVDLVVTLTTPPLLHAAAALGRRLRGQRYGIWSMDLHPDAEEAVGMLDPRSPLARALHALNDRGYRGADFVVDLGPFMKRRLAAKGVRPERLFTIPVWNRADEVAPVAKADNPLAHELGLEDRLVVMYSGNAGLAHRFDEVLEVMRRLKNRDDLFFLFVGSGPRRAEIEAFARLHGLRHFRYLDYFDREQLRFSLPLGDVHLVTLRDAMAGIAAPGKVYGIMAAGRPVVFVGPAASEPAATVAEAGAGFVFDTTAPGDAPADALEAALLALAADPAARAAMGARGRAAFLARYERDVACAQWSALLRRRAGVPEAAGRAPSVLA